MSEESMGRLGFALLLVSNGVSGAKAARIAFSREPDVFAAAFRSDETGRAS